MLDKIIWIGAGRTGQYCYKILGEKKTPSIIVPSRSSEKAFWENTPFYQNERTGWIIAVSDPETATRYLKGICLVGGTHYVSLLTEGVKNIPQKSNVYVFYDAIRGKETREFLKASYEITNEFKERCIFLLYEEKNSLLGKSKHSRSLSSMIKILHSTGAICAGFSSSSNIRDYTKYTLKVISIESAKSRPCTLFNISTSWDSNQTYAIDAIETVRRMEELELPTDRIIRTQDLYHIS